MTGQALTTKCKNDMINEISSHLGYMLLSHHEDIVDAHYTIILTKIKLLAENRKEEIHALR